MDEPQSVDGGLQGRGREALAAMHPLCTLRYSATHTDRHHMVYRLNAVDAYERKLVKQIEVASATVHDAHNRPYVRLVSTSNRRGTVSARVEIDVETAGKVRRRTKVVQDGEDLEQATSRGVYRDCRIGEIRVEKGNEFVELRVPGGECYLRLGEAWGDVDALAVQRQMIRRTIREHLDKEKRLRPQGIKVLSLFFIIGRSGVEATETAGAATTLLDETAVELPDVLTELQDRTQLTRRSIRRILCESGRLDDFKRNPQRFIELAAEAINRCKRSALVDGIKYQRLGDDDHYAQELFESEELTGYLKNMLSETKKSVYEQVVFDSGIEAAFAEQLEKNPAVRVYAKLPGWFTVPTPLGSYNPDWAVLIDSEEGERLYLVVETKGSLFAGDLRGTEGARIKCGKAHFDALGVAEPAARYEVARNLDDLFAGIGSG